MLRLSIEINTISLEYIFTKYKKLKVKAALLYMIEGQQTSPPDNFRIYNTRNF